MSRVGSVAPAGLAHARQAGGDEEGQHPAKQGLEYEVAPLPAVENKVRVVLAELHNRKESIQAKTQAPSQTVSLNLALREKETYCRASGKSDGGQDSRKNLEAPAQAVAY